MTCGAMPNIWPNPTGKTIGSSQSLTFQSHSVRLQISTKFKDVERLLEDAFGIFLTDIKALESGNTLNEMPKRYVASDTNNDKTNEQESDQVTHRNRNCDIQNVDVNVVVSHSDVTFVHLDMNESYNLTIKSKLTRWYMWVGNFLIVFNL